MGSAADTSDNINMLNRLQSRWQDHTRATETLNEADSR